MTASGMRKNEINRLSSEELTFELTYRGLPTSRVQEMRKSLRNVLKLEKIGTFANVTTVSFTDAMEYIASLFPILIRDFFGRFNGDR